MTLSSIQDVLLAQNGYYSRECNVSLLGIPGCFFVSGAYAVSLMAFCTSFVS